MFDSGPLTAVSFAGSPLKDDQECSASAASIETGPTIDSAIGDSVSSKRSSLDRKSQTSFVDWASDVESHCSPRFPDDEGLPEEEEDLFGGEKPSSRCNVPKKRLPLPSISLPRGLFSRTKHAPLTEHSTYSGSSWRFFSDKRPMKDPNVVSTMGLILETRPSNLPAKSEEEEAKHRAQYLELIEQARKKEAREAKERKRAAELQRRLEDQAAAACRQWSETILPKWEEMKNSKRCRELWWQGIPSKVRGRVWSLVIGNELSLTEDLYNICCSRALEKISAAENGETDVGDDSPLTMPRRTVSGVVEDFAFGQSVNRESTVELIHLDVSRTFPTLGIFQKGGPYYDLLLRLLGAYVCYRPDVGYVQSMSFVAAVLLLQMDPYEAFVAFANLLNRPLQLAFFRLRQPEMTEYFIAYDQYFDQELHKLHSHFDQLDVRPDLYLIEWVYTLYAKSLPLDVTCRVWDMFLRDGEEFLFKTALGILRLYERQLLEMDFEEVVQFLTHLPESMTGAELFRNIEPFMRSYASTSENAKCKRRFLQILADVNERINPGSSLGSSDRLSASASGRAIGDSASQCSQLSQLSTNMQNLKLSKSLSGFLGDLLKPPPPAHDANVSPSMRRSPTCPLSHIASAAEPSSTSSPTQCATSTPSSSS
ncbi:TBC1 domain family member 14 [Toxocara canis]|uniref:TBC1 domain family member 14 n=1 Tax=Toxocara canis TaxID=6265 RepID=A0A0B2V1S5_TOXCA|nr:TBC1 domain family member 14 [Toxocara canis]